MIAKPQHDSVDFSKAFFIKIDASNFTLNVILSQIRTNNKLQLVAFHSKKFLAIEINYEIYNKELLIIIDYFSD